MTHNLPLPSDQAESAADRVRAFLAVYGDNAEGAAICRIQTAKGSLPLTASDLRTLIHQAEGLRHAAPHAHRVIEAQYRLDSSAQ